MIRILARPNSEAGNKLLSNRNTHFFYIQYTQHLYPYIEGPVIKIDPQDLPQAPNLHYPGMKDYNDLPAYLSHFDVALVTFDMNEATRFLSPTKTLEYLAAHKPMVSTPIPDIVELYGDYVRIGHTPKEFTEQIETALAASDAERAERRRQEQQLLSRYT